MLDEIEIINKICNILKSYETSYRLEERDDIFEVSFYEKDKNIVIVNYYHYDFEHPDEKSDNNYDCYIVSSKIDLNKNEILDEKCRLVNNEWKF